MIPALVGAALLAAWLDADSGIRAYLRLRDDVGAGEAHLQALRSEIGVLEAEQAALEKHGSFAQERAIREDLEWARPGETVVRLPAPARGADRPDGETP